MRCKICDHSRTKFDVSTGDFYCDKCTTAYKENLRDLEDYSLTSEELYPTIELSPVDIEVLRKELT